MLSESRDSDDESSNRSSSRDDSQASRGPSHPSKDSEVNIGEPRKSEAQNRYSAYDHSFNKDNDTDEDHDEPLETEQRMVEEIDTGDYSREVSQFISQPVQRYSKSIHVFDWGRDDEVDVEYEEEGLNSEEIDKLSNLIRNGKTKADRERKE